ncbi:hypothetical protein BX666DRAFT_1877628 [Dichotomocladium elegans]|nr:hypothetical protein BX666DRAFT_1877628 [Dichotomocladium elegans]
MRFTDVTFSTNRNTAYPEMDDVVNVRNWYYYLSLMERFMEYKYTLGPELTRSYDVYSYLQLTFKDIRSRNTELSRYRHVFTHYINYECLQIHNAGDRILSVKCGIQGIGWREEHCERLLEVVDIAPPTTVHGFSSKYIFLNEFETNQDFDITIFLNSLFSEV